MVPAAAIPHDITKLVYINVSEIHRLPVQAAVVVHPLLMLKENAIN